MGTYHEIKGFQGYSQISIGNEKYRRNDAIIWRNDKEIEVAEIDNIFDMKDETIFSVKKYIFAKKFKKIFKKQGLEYDQQNEVVRDLSQIYNISASQIIKKCIIALSTEDNVCYIDKDQLDPSNYFVCRFAVKGNQLFPIKNNILKETSLNSPTTKIGDVNKLCADMGTENCTPITNVNNPVEIYFENATLQPSQRNSVKRDLNKSFGNSPTSGNKSILNYSIISISDDDSDSKLTIKLKVSKKRSTESQVNSPPKIRKSSRDITRISYADYISPKKDSPTKRPLSKSRQESDRYFDPRQNKQCRSTPKKQTENKNSRSSTREIKTPKRYVDEISIMNHRTPHSAPARRRLTRLSSAELQNSPKSVRNTRRNISNEDEDLGVSRLEVNLDDSLRRNILKVNLKRLNSDTCNNQIDTDEECENEQPNLDVSMESKVMTVNLEKLNINMNNGSDDNDYVVSDSVSEDESISSKVEKRNMTRKLFSHSPMGTPKSTRKTTPAQIETSPKKKSKVNPKSSKVSTPKTPKNRAKLIRDGIVTPSMQERSRKIKGDSTPLMKARSQLHVSYVPESLPCREKEYCDVYNFVEGKLLDGCGGCMYVSGVPGTGKTATVTSVIKHLQENKDVPKFTFVNVNGMRLTEPRQAYVEILKQLRGKSLSWEQSQNTLEEMFVKQKKMAPIVMLIDELDILCTKRQDVVYNLLDWPTKAKSQLIVITIANTMDLPERLLMNRVTSRLGLTRLTFQAYTYKQLQEIVTRRLCGTDTFKPDAVQFVARKVASVSGDARRALDICRRAAEIAEAEGKNQLVNMTHVNEALSAMITQPKVLAIKSCSRLEQLILQSTVAEVERTGVEETTFCDIYKMLVTCAAIEGFKIVSPTLAQSAVAKLSACRLILSDQKCNNIYQKIILNVSVDDVYFALKNN